MAMISDISPVMTTGPVRGVRFDLFQDEQGRLIYVDEQGQRYEDVSAVRAFPISDDTHGIAVITASGKEVAWIEDLGSVPAGPREVLEFALQQRQFMPTIIRVHRISRLAEPNDWEVETDRGLTRFPLRSEEDVLRLSGNRALIIDAHGVRYLIPDINRLDARSRRLLERYL